MTFTRDLRRYWRAFTGAVRLTLRGETISPPPQTFPKLRAWWSETIRLSDAVISAADANELPLAARKAWKLHIEGRDLSLETIIAAVRYHAAAEFPDLMRAQSDFNILALQATTLNDRFLLLQLTSADLPVPVRTALETLAAHLLTIPLKEDL